jgi:hypothetical protein
MWLHSTSTGYRFTLSKVNHESQGSPETADGLVRIIRVHRDLRCEGAVTAASPFVAPRISREIPFPEIALERGEFGGWRQKRGSSTQQPIHPNKWPWRDTSARAAPRHGIEFRARRAGFLDWRAQLAVPFRYLPPRFRCGLVPQDEGIVLV